MKFVVVNHRTPLCGSACLHCSRSLGAGYLRDVPTQRPYCDYTCYRRDEATRALVPWFTALRGASRPAADQFGPFAMMTSLAAAVCWGYAIPLSALATSVVQAALGFRELMTTEVVPVRRPG